MSRGQRILSVLGGIGLVLSSCTLLYSRDDYVGAVSAESGSEAPPDVETANDAAPAFDAGAEAEVEADALAPGCDYDADVYFLVKEDGSNNVYYTASWTEVEVRTGNARDPDSGTFEETHLYGGVVFRVTTTADDAGSVPVYRLRNPRTDVRVYTTDALEKDLLRSAGFSEEEGIAFYALPPSAFFVAPSSGCVVPVEGFRKNDLRQLGAGAEQKAEFQSAGWESEGTRFFAALPRR